AEGDEQPSWSALVPTAAPSEGSSDSEVRLVDPVRSSSGLATLALISNTIDDADQEGRPQLVAALQSLQKGATPTEEAAFEAFAEQSSGDGADPVLVLSEQAALRYNHDHGDAPAHVSYPKGGSYSLDYPYVTRTDDPLTTRAAEVFRGALTQQAAQDRFLSEGFRTADGKADPEALPDDQGLSTNAEAPAHPRARHRAEAHPGLDPVQAGHPAAHHHRRRRLDAGAGARHRQHPDAGHRRRGQAGPVPVPRVDRAGHLGVLRRP